MFLEMIVVGPLQENSYVVACEETQEAVIIDPGAEADRIYQVIADHGLRLRYVFATHGHPDHIGGVAPIVRETGVPFLIHEADMFLLEGFNHDPIRAYLAAEFPPPPDRFLQDEETISLGKLEFKVFHTPGHTPGGLCFLTGKTLFSGDTLFANSIGRTDLPGGDYQQLHLSIQKKLLSLSDEVKIYSGHGRETTIAAERQFNPFFSKRSL